MGGRLAGMWWSVVLCACTAAPPRLLLVELRTDLAPGAEVRAARVTVTSREGGAALFEELVPLERDLDLIAGARIAEIELPPATYQLRVELLDRRAEVAVGRLTIVDVSADRVATIVLTRSCVGVDCSSDPASIETCFGGGCVDPECSPETPESCPPPECTSAADCPTPIACAEAVCVEGACGIALPAGRCAPGERCDLEMGCVCDPIEGLVLAWSFEEGMGTTAASRPAGLDATLSGMAAWSATAGSPCGGALDLAGDDSIATLDADAIDAALEGDFTIVVWVRTAQTGGMFPNILSKEDALGARLGPSLVLHGGGAGWYFEFYDATGAHQARGGVVSDDAWHQLVGVREGDRIRAYEDGVKVADEQVPGASGSIRNALALTLGDKPDRAPLYTYEGFLDEVRIFDGPLTDDEVMTLYLDHMAGCACQ